MSAIDATLISILDFFCDNRKAMADIAIGIIGTFFYAYVTDKIKNRTKKYFIRLRNLERSTKDSEKSIILISERLVKLEEIIGVIGSMDKIKKNVGKSFD